MTERLHFDFSLSCIGEGNGNPLQCSCLESPRDGGAWWADVYGVTQSQPRLKRLSSSIPNVLGGWFKICFLKSRNKSRCNSKKSLRQSWQKLAVIIYTATLLFFYML